MRDKILLSIIFVLIIAITYINIGSKYFNFQKNNEENITGQVKSATINNDVFSFKQNISTRPQKNDSFYSPDDIWANSYILIDEGSSEILTAQNENDIVPIASTTKIMTAIVALENYNLDDIFTISEDASYQTPTVIGLMPQEQISAHDLLYGLLIKSGNDTAYALAENMGFDNFVNKMNEKAKYLGLNDTNFKDPAGLNDEGRSTAHDMAFIAAYALKFDVIRQIVTTPEKTIYSADGLYEHYLDNSNRLILSDGPLYYQPAIGLKTGYTPDAGHCLVSAAQKDGHTLISVVLNTYEDTAEASAKESRKLLDWGFNCYSWNN